MKLNELIKKYKKLEGVWNAEGAELVRQIFLQDLEQLDKPQPVKVPQCVAEYIEFKKKNNFHVYGLAWLNGYEVEKEKRYFVKIKGNIKENMLVYGELLKRYFFTKSFSLDDVIPKSFIPLSTRCNLQNP
ncbi:phage protein [Streptococcus pneumoniae]|nr:phage protein [Streptococcus pneumoniae]VOR65089.1 phage protein [Streptococcus pneumoniae]VPJ99443.1 phage protein [Streptococcus pneumoniae]VPL88115.1 phage protein [Streptococcus pneumoniae]